MATRSNRNIGVSTHSCHGVCTGQRPTLPVWPATRGAYCNAANCALSAPAFERWPNIANALSTCSD
eukprot:2545451-Lingulodinium_polyedra.AAC.1